MEGMTVGGEEWDDERRDAVRGVMSILAANKQFSSHGRPPSNCSLVMDSKCYSTSVHQHLGGCRDYYSPPL